MSHSESIMLICTVGGSPEPVVAALKHWQPIRVRFIYTPQTKDTIETKIAPQARAEGVNLDAGRYDFFELPDGQDLAGCLDRLRRLSPDVEQWVARGEMFQVVVDITGGTKCMSAAIALQASRWPCIFSYVGGRERTKAGVGVVVSGTEKIVYHANPWDALGYQAVEEFVVLFDQCAFAAAANVVGSAKTRVSRPDRKRELSVIESLAKAFDAWDRFDHKAARSTFKNIEKAGNDLQAALGHDIADRIYAHVERAMKDLDELCSESVSNRHHVFDLLANARRRSEEGRIDDAVARLYRAIEALAQVALKEDHGIDNTENVPVEIVPETLRSQWEPKVKQGCIALGLQDAYTLLDALGNPLGKKFRENSLAGTKSPLAARNRSILAHGFERVSEKVFERLWMTSLDLADAKETDLPSFLSLGGRPASQVVNVAPPVAEGAGKV